MGNLFKMNDCPTLLNTGSSSGATKGTKVGTKQLTVILSDEGLG
jgi:hypothetical protein